MATVPDRLLWAQSRAVERDCLGLAVSVAREDDPQLANEDDIPEPRQRKRKRGLFARIFGLDEGEPPIIERLPRKDGALY